MAESGACGFTEFAFPLNLTFSLREKELWVGQLLFESRLDSDLHAAHGSGYAGHGVDVVADDVADAVEAVGFNHADDVVGTGYSVDLDCLIKLFQGFKDGVAFASLGFDQQVGLDWICHEVCRISSGGFRWVPVSVGGLMILRG